MLRHQEVPNIHGFTGQSSLQRVFNAASPQSRKDFHGHASQDFVRALSGQPLHERVEELIAQFAVIKDDALGRTHDDRLADLGSGLGGPLSIFSADASHDLSDDWLDGIVGKRERIAFGHKADGLASTVQNDLAGLALVQMRFETHPQLRIGRFLQILSEFGEELGAAKHRHAPGRA